MARFAAGYRLIIKRSRLRLSHPWRCAIIDKAGVSRLYGKIDIPSDIYLANDRSYRSCESSRGKLGVTPCYVCSSSISSLLPAFFFPVLPPPARLVSCTNTFGSYTETNPNRLTLCSTVCDPFHVLGPSWNSDTCSSWIDNNFLAENAGLSAGFTISFTEIFFTLFHH